MKPRLPLTKVQMLQKSLRCFVEGLLSLLPVIGLLFAVMASADYLRVKRQKNTAWNAARRYLQWGNVLTVLGFLIQAIVYCLLISAVFSSYVNGD